MNQIEKIIDIATWNRREHYEHFSAFDDPFFGVTVNVDCTRAYQEAKDKGVSFSLLVLHRIVTAAAAVEEFRLSCNSWGIKFSQFPSCIYLC